MLLDLWQRKDTINDERGSSCSERQKESNRIEVNQRSNQRHTHKHEEREREKKKRLLLLLLLFVNNKISTINRGKMVLFYNCILIIIAVLVLFLVLVVLTASLFTV